MRFLVTGGAGFIGSHLCDHLLEAGHDVNVLDDLSTGSVENLAHLEIHDGLHCTVGSVADGDVLDALVARSDVVVHLAAAVGVRLVVESPVRAIETNVHCTEVVLAHAERHGKPVLIASTSEVYGKSSALPFREDGDLQMGSTDKSRWAYACSKAIDEFLAMAYWRERGLPVIVVRLFNTVGPRQTGSYGMVVPTLVSQALAGQPLSVYGDGRQTRCFCHVSDVVRALTGLIDEDRAYGNVFNVGATTEISILDLARRIIALTGSSSDVALTAYADAYGDGFEDMYRRIPDITKIGELIGWSPTRSLDDVVLDVVQHQTRRESRV
ncbi:MAG: nucleoside-diphosphate-sugar epimerase [Solirubrobacterales bacterium]|jgi:UDP-glucose 4-epimerase|nr:nucleoside-diphosphate-sugar epimerase [Solirubrobacterales bacterium]